MVNRTRTATLLAVLAVGEASADKLGWLDAYNVVWTAPSANSSESMPVGGHDLGLNGEKAKRTGRKGQAFFACSE